MNPVAEGNLIQNNWRAALEPVTCTDCGASVPLGWVIMATVKCSEGKGWGHRAKRDDTEVIFRLYGVEV